jgi:hypothetical protein
MGIKLSWLRFHRFSPYFTHSPPFLVLHHPTLHPFIRENTLSPDGKLFGFTPKASVQLTLKKTKKLQLFPEFIISVKCYIKHIDR